MIKVYGQQGCPPCAATKRTLENSGVEFDYIDIRNDKVSLDEARIIGKFGMTPIVVTDNDSWAGFDAERLANLTSV